MQKVAQINFIKLIGLIISMVIIKEVIPDYLIQDPELKSIYKMAFLGILTITVILFSVLLLRKNGFSNINNSLLFGLLSFWAIYSWIQYFGIFL